MAASAEQLTLHEQVIDYETRRDNDTVTWLAEVLPGSMRTLFEYQFDGRELYASDGSAIGEVFDESIRQAAVLPRYEQRRRQLEKDEYHDMLAMMRGELPNTMVVISDFPSELMDTSRDAGGYNVSRKQTMLRVLVRTSEGTLKMYSQSLDGSDRRALESIYSYFGKNPQPGELLGQRIHANFEAAEQEFLIDWLTGVYDRRLAQLYGGEWYAGQRSGRRLNTYDFARQQKDLIRAYLASTDRFTGGKADYNLAAAMLKRFQGEQELKGAEGINHVASLPIAAHVLALEEMRVAGEIAQGNGMDFSGCGATLMAEKSGADQLAEAGYGNQADKPGRDQYGSLQFKCPKKGCVNTRKPGKLIEKCQKCGANVRCD